MMRIKKKWRDLKNTEGAILFGINAYDSYELFHEANERYMSFTGCMMNNLILSRKALYYAETNHATIKGLDLYRYVYGLYRITDPDRVRAGYVRYVHDRRARCH